jgi:hypothetical protein
MDKDDAPPKPRFRVLQEMVTSLEDLALAVSNWRIVRPIWKRLGSVIQEW